MRAALGSAAAMAMEPRLDPPEDGDECEVAIEFNDAAVTAAITVTVVAGIVDVQVDGLLHGGLYLDADDLSDSAQQRIAELARAALLREAAE